MGINQITSAPRSLSSANRRVTPARLPSLEKARGKTSYTTAEASQSGPGLAGILEKFSSADTVHVVKMPSNHPSGGRRSQTCQRR